MFEPSRNATFAPVGIWHEALVVPSVMVFTTIAALFGAGSFNLTTRLSFAVDTECIPYWLSKETLCVTISPSLVIAITV